MPTDRIYVVDPDDTLHALERRAYASEDLLQTLLERYPDLLAGDQMGDEPRRWALVAREIGVPGEEDGSDRWSLDHLFLDQDGVPTLVEVKRSTDTRIRREVVGQMLDYAANAVVYWPVDRLAASFEATCDAEGVDAVERVAALTGAAEDDAWEDYWQLVKTNLQAGRVRLVFVADVIPDELRRIVEFLNGQMDPAEVLAVEVRQYVGGELRTLVPRVVGQTAQAEQKKGGARRTPWDEPRFMAALEASVGPTERAVAERLLAWARGRGVRIYWGKGTKNGSFTPILDLADEKHFTFSVWSHTGAVEVMFQHMKAPFDTPERRREVLERIQAIPGLALRHENVDARPSFPLAALAEPDRLGAFLAVCDHVLDRAVAAAEGRAA